MAKRNLERLKLPTARSTPVDDPWQYAYLISGEKKIGKTTFSIEGAEELVLQFDKPQLAYAIREVVIESWKHFARVLKEIERMVAAGDFPYNRIVIDGAGEWYQMCQIWTCEKFQVEHPSEVGYARAWHWMRDNFTDAVNRILRLQDKAQCGVIFIAHSEWKEKQTRSGTKVDKLVPNLPGRCEEIINGKVDGWFAYDYSGEDRILVVQGDESTGAGHRMDGHFVTKDGRPVREILMGNSASEALEAFLRAFNNEQEHATIKEARVSGGAERRKKRGSGKKKTTAKKTRKKRRRVS